MALLGLFREGIDKVRFHLKANKPLIPLSVKLKVTVPPNPQVSLAIGAEPDTDSIPNNEYKNVPDLDITAATLGIAMVEYSAKDNQGHLAQRSDTIKVISSYGRNYGLDYGNGL